jgi:hypothetical protein
MSLSVFNGFLFSSMTTAGSVVTVDPPAPDPDPVPVDPAPDGSLLLAGALVPVDAVVDIHETIG